MKACASPKETFALRLFDIGAVKTKIQSPGGLGFKLKKHEKDPSAPLSPIFFNLRVPENKQGKLTPNDIHSAVQLMRYLPLTETNPYAPYIAGLPLAGDPFAEAMSKYPSRELVKLRKENIDDKRAITAIETEGIEPGKSILLLDDLITGADSKLEAICVCESAGLVVKDIIVLLDREQGGAQTLRQLGYNLQAVYTISELLKIYEDHSKISPETAQEIRDYLAAEAA